MRVGMTILFCGIQNRQRRKGAATLTSNLRIVFLLVSTVEYENACSRLAQACGWVGARRQWLNR